MLKILISVLALAFLSSVIEGLPSTNERAVQYHNVAPGDRKPTAITKRQAGGCSCTALVYDSTNYRGRSLKLSQQNAEFSNDFFNDRVESIRLNGNCKWLFHQGANFLSSSHLLTAGYYSSAPRWGGSGNQISSARALPPDNTVAICLFQHPNYQGRMLVLYGSNSHLPSLNFGDAISSIIITGGTWTLFEHSNYRGRSSRLVQGEYPDLHSFHIGGDSVSSVRRG